MSDGPEPRSGMNSMKKPIIITIIALILFGAAIFLLINYKPNTPLYPKLEEPKVMGTERYKIVGTVLIPNEKDKDKLDVGIVVHLDDGRLKVVSVQQTARDQDLLNVNEGYLYRINGQFYLKKN